MLRIQNASAPAAPTEDLTGPGWVVKIEGYHYHNGVQGDEKADFVRKNLIHFLETGKVKLPGPDGTMIEFTTKEMGISHPMLMKDVVMSEEKIGNPEYERVSGGRAVEGSGGGYGGAGGGYGSGYSGGGGGYGGGDDRDGGSPAAATATNKPKEYLDEDGDPIPPFYSATKASFVVQFVWRERTLDQRLAWRQDPRYKPDIVPPKDAGKDGSAMAAPAAPASDVPMMLPEE